MEGASNIKAMPEAFMLCSDDIKEFCPNVPPGQGRLHACLLTNRFKLRPQCAAVEFHNQEVQAKDVFMSPEARKFCGPIMQQLCPDVNVHSGKMWACLEDRMRQEGQEAIPADC